MKRTTEVSKKLFIQELERPPAADAEATTLAIGEEADAPIWQVTSMGLGEEAGNLLFALVDSVSRKQK